MEFVYNTSNVVENNIKLFQPETNIVIKKLVAENNPILKEKMPIFDFSKENAIAIASELTEAILKYSGYGLAANQIGLKHRVFVIKFDDEHVVAMFNPEILSESVDVTNYPESCLSIPFIQADIKRPKRITVRYQDYLGNFHEKEYEGFTAKIFLHELDHLNGILFTDHLGKVALRMAKKKQEKQKKLHHYK